jgi:hypothetical protein
VTGATSLRTLRTQAKSLSEQTYMRQHTGTCRLGRKRGEEGAHCANGGALALTT